MTSGNFISPVSPAPSHYDLALDVVLQQWVSGVTGLPGNMVRPRWQPITPTYPTLDENWCAVGVTGEVADTNAYTKTIDEGSGFLEVHRHSTLNVLVSFYGDHAGINAGVFRDGVYVDQNRGALMDYGLAVQTVDTMNRVPALINQQWQNRVDLPIILRRHTVMRYPVHTVTEIVGQVIDGDNGTTETFDTGTVET